MSVYRAGIEQTKTIIVTTTNDVQGFAVEEYLGMVRGLAVRQAHYFGGVDVVTAGRVCEEARYTAYMRMLAHAEKLNANGIIGMRYDSSVFMQGATEVLAYGTAVRLKYV